MGAAWMLISSHSLGISVTQTRLRSPLVPSKSASSSSTLEARALLSLQQDASEQRVHMQQSRQGSHVEQVSCAAAPAVEVISLGEVADVEEIEGLRVVMNEYKRPVVEYLIKWKVRSPFLAGMPTSAMLPSNLSCTAWAA